MTDRQTEKVETEAEGQTGKHLGHKFDRSDISGTGFIGFQAMYKNMKVVKNDRQKHPIREREFEF